MSRREAWTHGTNTFFFALAAVALAWHDPPSNARTWAFAIVFSAAVGLASRIELEIGSGFASPVELVLIPALFALPAGAVPLTVAAGLVAAQLPRCLRGRVHPDRIVIAAGNASYTLAPAAVFLLLFHPGASPGRSAAVTMVALGAQFAADMSFSMIREQFAVRVDARSLVEPFGWIMIVDTCLAPVGLAAGLAGTVWAPAYLLPLPLLLAARLLAHERSGRLSHALDLSAAYRGTAFLLGDVINADDEYTGAHSRDVVELALEVSDRLGLDARNRHLVELAALLHDVGKIRIPKAIINKPGPLTSEERALINTHTIEGEQLLAKVGGVLAEVGAIVRSCHEHYDGRGYPDGLAGDDIPLVARIVSCCDAFNAMTTTRSYRVAMPQAEAHLELRRHRGTQFDPHVVDAILAATSVAPPSTDMENARQAA